MYNMIVLQRLSLPVLGSVGINSYKMVQQQENTNSRQTNKVCFKLNKNSYNIYTTILIQTDDIVKGKSASPSSKEAEL